MASSASAASPAGAAASNIPNVTKWVCVYPVYLNKNRSLHEGRRVSKEVAVEDPTAPEIYMACRALGFTCAAEERKRHPRDFFTFGRIRVKMFKDDSKTPLHGSIQSRPVLLDEICKTVAARRASGVDSAAAAAATAASQPSGESRKSKKGK